MDKVNKSNNNSQKNYLLKRMRQARLAFNALSAAIIRCRSRLQLTSRIFAHFVYYYNLEIKLAIIIFTGVVTWYYSLNPIITTLMSVASNCVIEIIDAYHDKYGEAMTNQKLHKMKQQVDALESRTADNNRPNMSSKSDDEIKP